MKTTPAEQTIEPPMLPTPYRKVLIANRGEVALRIDRSAKQLGYRTVAVYSDADRDSAHAIAADQAVCIGGTAPAESYLDIQKIIDAARLTGADAVHPGYGFLAENPALARACHDAGIVFIGPSPDAIVAMGNKAAAKQRMQKAGVPCVPGYDGEDQSLATLMEQAQRIGFPIMIKAADGGGGRGMRLVDSAAAFTDALASAQSEARSAFGSAQVILERAITAPRHIEVQILADRYGHVVHLGERDCSIQRRHQKLIEEAPSPAVDASLRARMGEAAVAAVKAIRYEGAGTLEFLLDAHGDYYFIEMNTRLQVEHPVTELITGIDIVAQQLRIAHGEPLSLMQSDIVLKGHAIEARLCAEDVASGFLPQSGRLTQWKPDVRVRVEHALSAGATIPPYYDSMVAKLISYGGDRDEARRKLVTALEDTIALGVKTNQRFLAQCLRHEMFTSGAATTAFIGDYVEELLEPDLEACERFVAIAAVLMRVAAETSAFVGAEPPAGASLTYRQPVGTKFKVDGQTHAARLEFVTPLHYRVRIAERDWTIVLESFEAGDVRFVCEGIRERLAMSVEGRTLLCQYRGQQHHVEPFSHGAVRHNAGADGSVRASMNGLVIALHAEVGDRVTVGQSILTLEAMKMEHLHAAQVEGVVRSIDVAVGEQVSAQRILVQIEPETLERAADEAS